MNPFRTVFFLALVFAVLALCLVGCVEPTKPPTPTGVWTVSSDLIPSSSKSLYLVVAPDGQQFLLTGGGGIVPYVPRMVAAPPPTSPPTLPSVER